AAAVVHTARELRLPGETVRPRRAPAAARAARGLEGDLLGRRPRGADRATARVRPAVPAAGPVRRDRGLRAPDPAAGRRPRRLPRRRPARQDRPCLDGLVARGPRALPRHRRRWLRVLAAGATQGTRTRKQAVASP